MIVTWSLLPGPFVFCRMVATKPQNSDGGTVLTASSPAGCHQGCHLSVNRTVWPGSPGAPGREPLPGLGLAQSEFSNGIVRRSLSLANHVHLPKEKRGALLSVFSASVWLPCEQRPRLALGSGPSASRLRPRCGCLENTCSPCPSEVPRGLGAEEGAQTGAFVSGGAMGPASDGVAQGLVKETPGGNRARVLWELHPLPGWQWGHRQWRAGAGKAVDCLCLWWVYLSHSFCRVTKRAGRNDPISSLRKWRRSGVKSFVRVQQVFLLRHLASECQERGTAVIC